MKRKKLKEISPVKVAKSRKSENNNSENSELPIDVKSFVKEVKQLLKNETTLLTGLSKLRDALRKKEGKGFNVFVEFVKDNSECPEIYRPLEKGHQSQAPLERKKEGKGFNVFVEFVKDNSECPEIYRPLEKGHQSQAPLERKKEGKGFNVFVEFVKDNSECPEIYRPLEKGHQSQAPLELQIAIEVLEQLLLQSADNTSYASVGMYHVRRIMQNHLKLLYSCLNPACHINMIKGALKLLVGMVAQGAFAAREIVAVFDFTLKAFGGLVSKTDSKNNESIRTCFIKFVMSFFMFGDDATIRHILNVKGLVSSIFKLFSKDPPYVIIMVIKTLHEKVVKNNQVPKKSKVQLFSSYVLTQLSTLYKYSTNNDDADVENIREIVHALLQDVCCTFKYGICFVNKLGMFAGRSNNPILLRFLQSIPKTGHNPMLQDLIIKILVCCADLVQPYLISLKITYEPRLSLPWLANINFLIKIYSALPLPSVMISKSTIDITSESFLQMALNTAIPSVLTRINLNQGVQHSSLLVKNTTLSLISLVLNRAANLLDMCRKDISSSSKMEAFILHFTDELIKALPDVKTVLSLRQNLVASLEAGKEVKDEQMKEGGDDNQLTKKCEPSVLLSEVIQVVYYYQKVQPFILSSIAFDMSKLLPGHHQDINQNIFPWSVQYYTLKILLELPRGTFKWHHQKTKHGPSNMYSILQILVHTDRAEVRAVAEELINKFLQEEGIVGDDNTTEVEIWLRHLYNNSLKQHQESLVKHLDSILYTVAMEPYRYTDIVMEMSSQVRQGSDRLSFENAKDQRASFSPLVVRALMSHAEMISTSHHSYTVEQLGSVAKYINLVVLDFLRVMVNPLPLMLTIKRFYGDVVLPKDLSCLHNTHNSLLQYVGWWTGTPNVVDKKHKKKESVNFDKIKDPSRSDIIQMLDNLKESQLRQSFTQLLQVCSSSEEGFACLADHMACTPYCLVGTSAVITENVLDLAKKLPFPTLLWQLFGPLIINAQSTSSLGDVNANVVSVEALHHPEMQAILVDSLQKDNVSSYPTNCNHLLHYLSTMITVLRDKECVTVNVTSEDASDNSAKPSSNDVMTALALLFQLLELMFKRLCHASDLPRSSCEEEFGGDEERCVAGNSDVMRDFCKAFLGHPVLYECFVSTSNKQGAMVSNLISSLSSIIRSILDKVPVDPALIRPYIDIICDNAVKEITQAANNSVSSSNGQSLQLLQVFSSYCEHQNISRVVTSLLKLPINLLTLKSKWTRKSADFLETLLTLLDAPKSQKVFATNHLSESINSQEESPTDNNVSSRSADHRACCHMTKVTNQSSPQLSVDNFKRLIELAMEISSAKLDDIIHRFIKLSPRLLLNVTSEFLDFCLNNVTKEHVAIATTLISSSLTLRKHFELRCRSKKSKKLLHPLKIKNLVDVLPLVYCYLKFAWKNDVNLQDSVTVKFLHRKCWHFLWEWLSSLQSDNDGDGDSSYEDVHVPVLQLLIQLKANDVQGLKDKMKTLLNIASDHPWNIRQIAVVRTLLTSLKNEDDYELFGKVLNTCMQNISTTLRLNSGSNMSVEKMVEVIEDIICNNKEQLDHIVQCLEADVWSSFVKSCLKYDFGSLLTFKCMSACVKLLYNNNNRATVVSELPLTTMYEMVLTHSKFLEVIMDGNKESAENKGAVLDLVSTIAELSPESCQTSHLPVLFSAYNATLANNDQMLLYLLHVYERAQVRFSTHRPYLWGKAALEHHKARKLQGPSLWQQPSTNEVLELLDEAVLNQSAQSFPLDRQLKPRVQIALELSCYDPCFIIPLFCHLLAPNSEVDCRKFVERGGLGYTVAALSSRDDHMRKAAGRVLARYLAHLEAASFREKKQVLLLLVSFKNGIFDDSARVPSVITRFISRAAHLMLRPEHQMYIVVNSFLLQRAVLDIREVPLFYTLFNSSSLQYRHERMWVLGLLQEGLRDSQDYYVYKKRHVMELVTGFHDSQLSDQNSRKLVIGLVHNSLKIHAATFDLAKNYGIVSWIHSLCVKGNEESLSTSLSLLHTLWMTIQHGKPGASDDDVSGDDMNSQPMPPNLPQEALIVCKTLIRHLNKCALQEVLSLLELISSILTYSYQADSPQGSQLTHDELLRLITRWSELFNEQQSLIILMDELNMDTKRINVDEAVKRQPDEQFVDHRKNSLEQLVNIITSTKLLTSSSESSALITLLACNFALENSAFVDDVTSEFRHLSIVTWFRRCLVTSPQFQKLVVRETGEQCINRLLCLYDSTNFSLVQELNLVFMALTSRVDHVGNDVLGSSANRVAGLLSGDLYKEVMTSGIVNVLIPLYPSPETHEIEQVEVLVTELLSVFLQDLWYVQSVPSHFLDTLGKSRSEVSKTLVSIFLNGSTQLRRHLQTGEASE